jgi:hypothetical protein
MLVGLSEKSTAIPWLSHANFYRAIRRPIAKWPFQTCPVVVDPVVDSPNGANFKKGVYATLRRYKLHSNAHTTHHRTLVMLAVLQSSHPA